jgi:hypothetical protein
LDIIEFINPDGDGKIKISENDQTADYAEVKLVAGDDIKLDVLNGGGVEQLKISYNPTPPEGIKVFYVDGNNSVTGDGSILNPFKTIDSARAAVIGSGTTSAPDVEGATINVAGYDGANYQTSNNLAIHDITWNLSPGAVIDYTGTTHLFDLSAAGSQSSDIRVRGKGILKTSTGSIGKASNGGTYSRRLLIEADEIISTTPDPLGGSGNTKPMFSINGLNQYGQGVIIDGVNRIICDEQSVFDVANNGSLFVDMKGGIITLGSSSVTLTDKKVLSANTYQTIVITNLRISVKKMDYLFDIGGSSRNLSVENCKIFGSTQSGSAPGSILNVQSTFKLVAGAGGESAVIGLTFRDVFVATNTFQSATLINYTSSGPTIPDLTVLYLYNTQLPKPLPPNVKPNKVVLFGPVGIGSSSLDLNDPQNNYIGGTTHQWVKTQVPGTNPPVYVYGEQPKQVQAPNVIDGNFIYQFDPVLP